jgi:hypothetical protein
MDHPSENADHEDKKDGTESAPSDDIKVDVPEPEDHTPVDQLYIYYGLFHPIPLMFAVIAGFSGAVLIQNLILGQQAGFIAKIGQISAILLIVSLVILNIKHHRK